jgi:hypothetical protein
LRFDYWQRKGVPVLLAPSNLISRFILYLCVCVANCGMNCFGGHIQLHSLLYYYNMQLTKRWLSCVNSSRFHEALRQTELTVFEPIQDHGYFVWRAEDNRYCSLSDIKLKEQITSKINLHGKPKPLSPFHKRQFPYDIESLPTHGFYTKFPYCQYEIASLHVASVHRGVNLDAMDFVLCDSALEMLATKSNEHPHVAVRIPHSSSQGAILVLKNDKLFRDYARVQFQFQRVVTGTTAAYNLQTAVEFSEHLHEMQVGTYRVLFVGEVHASYNDEAVEVKCIRIKDLAIDTMLHMISSGSLWLCHGNRDFQYFRSAALMDLTKLVKRALRKVNGKTIQRHILENLAGIKAQMDKNNDADNVYELKFVDGSLQLLPMDKSVVVFPSSEVVRGLLKP